MQNSQIELDVIPPSKNMKSKLKDYIRVMQNHAQLIIQIKLRNIPKLYKFLNSYMKYRSLNEREVLNVSDLYPCINDNIPTTQFDSHYFYQGVWALKNILKSGVKNHVDIGSEVKWVGLLSAITRVTFIDIRPLKTDLKELQVKKGNILDMPFEDNSVDSLSSLHVLEHIGLGRYGDELDPEGTVKACQELTRVLSIGGNLYISVPVGKEKTHFNAHRIFPPKKIIKYFKNLTLVELSGITDSRQYIENIDIKILENSKYACGLFWFKKRKKIV